jgi:hypothetical protein
VRRNRGWLGSPNALLMIEKKHVYFLMEALMKLRNQVKHARLSSFRVGWSPPILLLGGDVRIGLAGSMCSMTLRDTQLSRLFINNLGQQISETLLFRYPSK